VSAWPAWQVPQRSPKSASPRAMSPGASFPAAGLSGTDTVAMKAVRSLTSRLSRPMPPICETMRCEKAGMSASAPSQWYGAVVVTPQSTGVLRADTREGAGPHGSTTVPGSGSTHDRPSVRPSGWQLEHDTPPNSGSVRRGSTAE